MWDLPRGWSLLYSALRTSKAGRVGALLLLALLLAASALFALGSGAADVPIHRAVAALIGRVDGADLRIVYELRAPRVLLGILVGGGLAMVGATLQCVLQNDLADPYILGVSAGAGVGATLSMLGAAPGGPAAPWSTALFAFIAALISVAIVYRTAKVEGSLPGPRLLLAGVAFSSFATALSAFLLFFAREAAQVRGVFFWLIGGLADASWPQVLMVSLVLLPSTALLFASASRQTVFLLGDEAAQSLGLSVMRTKAALIVIAALITATTVAVAGAIGFVGLIVPHALRPFFGPDQRFLLPAASLGGALLLVTMDTAARSLFVPEEVPVGVLTGLLGAPFFLLLLRRRAVGGGPL